MASAVNVVNGLAAGVVLRCSSPRPQQALQMARVHARPWPPSPTACLVRGFIPTRPPTPKDGLIHGQPGPRPELHPAGQRGLSMPTLSTAGLVHSLHPGLPMAAQAHRRPHPRPTSSMALTLQARLSAFTTGLVNGQRLHLPAPPAAQVHG